MMCVCICPQSSLILCEPMYCSLPGTSVNGIFQARILEWIAISFSRESSGIKTISPALADSFFTAKPLGKSKENHNYCFVQFLMCMWIQMCVIYALYIYIYIHTYLYYISHIYILHVKNYLWYLISHCVISIFPYSDIVFKTFDVIL